MSTLWIVGYRDFGFDVAEAAVAQGCSVAGYIDYDPEETRAERRQALVVPLDAVSSELRGEYVCAMTSTLTRARLGQELPERSQHNLVPGSVIHPSAVVSATATISPGTILNANAVVAAGAVVGGFGLINRGATVGHHTVLESYCTLGPGVNVGGNCRFGEHTYVGIGATILNRIQIGHHCLIAAGAVVTRDVPPHSVVMGVPAQVIRDDHPGR